MRLKCAVLDDYQDVAKRLADWSWVADAVDVTVFNEGFADADATVAALSDYEIICPMRERTLLSRAVIERLPKLRLIVTTGRANAAIDMAACRERGITVCGTDGEASPTVELTFALILEAARKAGAESARMHAGAKWQTVLGVGLSGKTLGVVGLGRLGSRVAAVAQAFGMEVIAWSRNLTAERCAQIGVERVSKEELFARSDFVTIHMKLGEGSKGLAGVAELAAMKPTAWLVNTSRGPIVDEAALITALRRNAIAGAALDVYDQEPLPADHPLRGMENVVLSPHLGYVTEDNLRIFYGQTIEDIRAWLDGAPIRVVE